MKLNKLFLILLGVSLISPVAITGCGGTSGGTTTASTPPMVGDPNNDSNVWMNITQNDGASEHSSMNLVAKPESSLFHA